MVLHVAVCFLLLWGSVLTQDIPPPYDLQTAYLLNPIGIDTSSPRLSWSLSHPGFAQSQAAYRVQVSEITESGNLLVWDTNEISSTHHYTPYGSVGMGKPLMSDTSYMWQVQWWDSNGTASNWSMPAYFDTGYLYQTDWKAEWIGGSGNLLRKEFTLNSNATRARAYISGLGYYQLYINGERVGDAQLDAGWTNFSARCLYNAYDVTTMLTSGTNAIGIMQGHGWYASDESREPDGPMSLKFQLSVDNEVEVVSDSSWSIAPGPIISDNVYNGETYDSRMEHPGWSSPGFIQSKQWISAVEVVSPGCILSYQTMPPIREKITIMPRKITNPKKGYYVIDFGQNFSGYTKVTITGPWGSRLSLKHAEVLLKDGSGMIYTANLRSAMQLDTYIFNGSTTTSEFQPHFTYHGFRYVQWNASDPSIVPTLDNIVAIHIHSDVPETGNINFKASSNILNMIQHNILWGQASNLMSVPTDCDQRDERKGWMGDAQLSCEEAIHNYYMPAFYTNSLQDIEDEQDVHGTITDTVPWTFGSRPADPSWGSAYPSILYWMWKYYDDIELVNKHYDSMLMYIQFLVLQHNKTGLAGLYYYYGDWVPPPPMPMCSSHITSSFSFLANLQQFIEMAAATDHPRDASTYTALLNSLRTEYNTAFYRVGDDFYDNGLQTPQALGAYLGLVPVDRIRNFTINLLNDIITYQETHLTTGIIGTKYLMLALHSMGRDDLALQLAENFDYPSWGYMAVNPTEPATTLWELWDTPDGSPGMDSRNHIMFGSVGDWFYKALAGIDHAPDDAGFAQFTIAPSVVGDLTEVSAYFESGMGNISVAWQLSGGSMVCGTAPEGYYLELNCESIGAGVIEEITFASFGLPRGTCGAFGMNSNCHGRKSQMIAEQECIGKKSCSLLAHEDFMGSTTCGNKSEDVFKRLHVQAKCSDASATIFTLQATIPVGSSADVVLPVLDLAGVTVVANDGVIWRNDKYVTGGAQGVSGGAREGNTLSFMVGSGNYAFNVTGSPGSIVCGNTTENFNLTIACPEPGQIITQIQFASYGDPYGECGNWVLGNCNAGSTKYMVENYCLLKSECEFFVGDDTFHDPCYGTPKYFASQVVCAKI